MMIDKLKLRVQTGVSYSEELLAKEELFGFAITEMQAIVGEKDIVEPFRLDIAYYRFLLLADVPPTDVDLSNYKQALAALKGANTIVTDPDTGESRAVSSMVRVGRRKSAY